MATGATEAVRVLIDVLYVLFATLIVVANTAPDLVLHERVGRTLDYLLTTRLPGSAIFLGKVIVAAATGYLAAMVAIALQLLIYGALHGQGWSWLHLGDPIGRILAFGITAALTLYVSVVGTFFALRVGDQRRACLVTVLSIGVVLAPLLLGWVHILATTSWFADAAVIFGAFAIVLAAVGRDTRPSEMIAYFGRRLPGSRGLRRAKEEAVTAHRPQHCLWGRRREPRRVTTR